MVPSFSGKIREKKTSKAAESHSAGNIFSFLITVQFVNHVQAGRSWAICDELRARRLERRASVLDVNTHNQGMRPGVTSNSVNQKSVTAVYTHDAPSSLFCAIMKRFFSRSPSRFTGTSLLPCCDVNGDGGNLEGADCFEFTTDRCSVYFNLAIKSFLVCCMFTLALKWVSV